MELEVQFPAIKHREQNAHIAIEKTKVEGKITISNANRLYPTSSFIFIENNGKLSILNIAKTTKNKPVKNMLLELKSGLSAVALSDIMEFMADNTTLELNFMKDFDGFIWIVSNTLRKESKEC